MKRNEGQCSPSVYPRQALSLKIKTVFCVRIYGEKERTGCSFLFQKYKLKSCFI